MVVKGKKKIAVKNILFFFSKQDFQTIGFTHSVFIKALSLLYAFCFLTSLYHKHMLHLHFKLLDICDDDVGA